MINRYVMTWTGTTAKTYDTPTPLNIADTIAKVKTTAASQIGSQVVSEFKRKGYDVGVREVEVTDVKISEKVIAPFPTLPVVGQILIHQYTLRMTAKMTVTSTQPLHTTASPLFYIPMIVWIIIAVGVSVGLALTLPKLAEWLSSLTTTTTDTTVTTTTDAYRDPTTGQFVPAKTTTSTTKTTAGTFGGATHQTSTYDPETGKVTTTTAGESFLGGANITAIAIIAAVGIGAYFLLKGRKKEEKA